MSEQADTRTVVIWEYPLALQDRQTVNMPRRSQMLAVQMQGRQITLWALVCPNERAIVRRTFLIVGTDHEVEADLLQRASYLGTVQDGGFVEHVFDMGEE